MSSNPKYIVAHEIATMLGTSEQYIRDNLRLKPDFPRPELIVRDRGGRRRLRIWLSRGVIRWMRQHRPDAPYLRDLPE
jgi:hypothetical protein